MASMADDLTEPIRQGKTGSSSEHSQHHGDKTSFDGVLTRDFSLDNTEHKERNGGETASNSKRSPLHRVGIVNVFLPN